MELTSDMALTRRISWGSIIAGIFTVMAVSLLLSLLGTSLGMAMISPKSDDIVNGADTTALIWTLVSLLISLACGAFITGRLAGVDGIIHGFLVWSTSLIIAAVLGFAAIGGIISMAGSAIGSVASFTGNVASSAAQAGGKGLSSLTDNVFNQLSINTDVDEINTDQKITNALKKSHIETLQPDYLKSQLQAAKDDTAGAIKEIAVSPEQSDTIIAQLLENLKQRSQKIATSIDKKQVTEALTANDLMDSQQARQAADNFIAARDKTINQVTQRLDKLEQDIRAAKANYAEMKQQAKEKADAAVKAMARIAFWSFVGLLIGAIISSVCGFWGVNTHPHYKKLRA